jgi:hypothetical protein
MAVWDLIPWGYNVLQKTAVSIIRVHKWQGAGFSETLVHIFQTTRCHIPQDTINLNAVHNEALNNE